MAAGDLITLRQLQTAYPALDAYQLADAPQLISAVSAEVAGRDPRVAPRAGHDETHDPGPHRVITLGRRPVLRVARVRADMAPVLRVNYAGAARRATCEVVTTGEAGAMAPVALELATEAGGVAADPVELDFESYPTVQSLADQVNDLPGWSAVVDPNQGGMASADLEPNQGPKSAGGAHGNGNGAAAWAYTRDLGDYDLVDAAAGELLVYEWRGESYRDPARVWGVDPRVCTLRVLYEAGVNAVPADVVRAVIIIVGAALESTDKPGVVAVRRSADTEYRLADPSYRFPDLAARILSRYKNRRFA